LKKRKRKLSNLVMIALILIAVFYFYVGQKDIYITADELADTYLSNTEQADNKFLNKKMELAGEVKSYYAFKDQPNLLELKIENKGIRIYSLFSTQKDDSLASTLTISTPVIVSGICTGIKNQGSMEGVYIEAGSISVAQNQ
jgi:hypothetical protein